MSSFILVFRKLVSENFDRLIGIMIVSIKIMMVCIFCRRTWRSLRTSVKTFVMSKAFANICKVGGIGQPNCHKECKGHRCSRYTYTN